MRQQPLVPQILILIDGLTGDVSARVLKRFAIDRQPNDRTARPEIIPMKSLGDAPSGGTIRKSEKVLSQTPKHNPVLIRVALKPFTPELALPYPCLPKPSHTNNT